MAFSDLTLIGFLKTKMQWHQGRQRVLAENIANADTPGYKANDLRPMRFENQMRSSSVAQVSAARTHSAHFAGAIVSEHSSFGTKSGNGWEVTPEGNAVVLEEQMIKVSENQFDFQMASTLYTRSIGLFKTALGRS